MKRKGFTLVELLAVIVVLALLIVLAVPVANKVINDTKKSAFAKYVDKLYLDVINTYEADKASNPASNYKCYLYDIKKDLDLDNTKDFEGYVVVVPSIDKPQVYFTLHNKSYYIKHYKYIKEESDSDQDKKTVLEVLDKYVVNEYEDDRDAYIYNELGCTSVVKRTSALAK